MATIRASIGKDHYTTELRSPGNNIVVADEPLELGGQDKGFTSSELLAAALGACTCITLRMYADRKEWPLDKVEAHVVFDRNTETNESFITLDLSLHGPLAEEQRQRLLQIAGRCPIHQTLTHPIHISTNLSDAVDS